MKYVLKLTLFKERILTRSKPPNIVCVKTGRSRDFGDGRRCNGAIIRAKAGFGVFEHTGKYKKTSLGWILSYDWLVSWNRPK